MGIWDELRLTAGKLFDRNFSGGLSVTDERRFSAKAVTQTGDAVRFNGAEKLRDSVSDLGRREKIGQILSNIGKFAVDSAVDESLKGVTGGVQVYKIVKEGLKDQPQSHNSNENKKPDLTFVIEEMHAKMEKMEEDMNNIKQKSEVSSLSAKVSEPLKELPNDPTKGLVPLKTDPKRVMIRSRL
ncbi:unnamed protein product [Camellia sinensis]